jgi:prefoldin subunit 5
MAGESEETLPAELQRWVDEQVAASDEDPADVLSRAVALYRLVEEHATGAGDEMPPVDDIESELDRLADRLADLEGRLGGVEDDLGEPRDDLESRVEAVEDDLEEKITDVRERVIQVKREADAKAPAEHDHGAFHTRLDDVETRVDRGFENYEEILSHLTDEADDLDGKLTRLAQVVVSLRRRTAQVEQQVTRLDAAADLKAAANRQGTTKAKCEACGGSVAIALLTEPACPHCETGFVGVESAGRLFGSGTLVTGRPPALLAGDDPDDPDERAHNGQHDAGNGRDASRPADAATELLGESKNV